MAPGRTSPSFRGRDRPTRWTVAGWTALVLGLAALSAWQGTLSRDSAGAHWSVGVAIAVAVVGAGVAGRGRQRAPSRAWLSGATHAVDGWRSRRPVDVAGVVVWTLLILTAIGWDLNSFVHQSHYLPTLSRLIGSVTRFDWGRGLFFAVWLGIGAYAAFGWWRPDPRRPGTGRRGGPPHGAADERGGER